MLAALAWSKLDIVGSESLVFPNRSGGFIDPHNFRARPFRRIVERALGRPLLHHGEGAARGRRDNGAARRRAGGSASERLNRLPSRVRPSRGFARIDLELFRILVPAKSLDRGEEERRSRAQRDGVRAVLEIEVVGRVGVRHEHTPVPGAVGPHEESRGRDRTREPDHRAHDLIETVRALRGLFAAVPQPARDVLAQGLTAASKYGARTLVLTHEAAARTA